MKSKFIKLLMTFFTLAFAFSASHAAKPGSEPPPPTGPVIADNASIVLLRTSCDNGSGDLLNNCFDDQTALMDWIKTTRNPGVGDTLTVEIGPGTYQRIEWLCAAGEGHVSFRGAGRGRTIFTNNLVLGNAMTFQNCEDLTFSSMTVDAKFISVVWAGSGNATWTDMELIAGYTTWYETPAGQLSSGAACTSGVNNEHKFFASSLITKNSTIGSLIYLNNCGITWLVGSELVFDGSTSTFSGPTVGVKSSGEGHEVHLYGSTIRLTANSGSASTGLIAFQAYANAEIHVHGTGIDLVSDKSIPITALEANTGGVIHAAESAYVMETGATGTATRIQNNGGEVHAPHFWSTPPGTNYTSANGADRSVVTTGTSDGFPHTVIYSSGCPSSARWYDAVDSTCR